MQLFFPASCTIPRLDAVAFEIGGRIFLSGLVKLSFFAGSREPYSICTLISKEDTCLARMPFRYSPAAIGE